MTAQSKKKSLLLPNYYNAVDPVMLKSIEPALSELTMVMEMTGDCQSLVTAKANECAWLDSVERFVTDGTTSDSASLTWSAFHSQRQPENGINSAVT